MSKPKYTNRLIKESSPYLLQHAHNPVDWYPWGEEALQKAKQEDKPILVSIGYSACHWCHVMEHESFENEQVAAFMNEHFINIKIDREERPDIDHIYMEALQAMTGQGGWPLNCFLTPDQLPFYGGTYFPPQQMYNKPDWLTVLRSISRAFKEKREEIEKQSANLADHISNKSERFFKRQDITLIDGEKNFDQDIFEEAYGVITPLMDKTNGGFGGAPKFPSSMSLAFLLRYHHYTGNQEALSHALFSINKMIDGGIYDHLGGGFARYTVDNAWLVPHFEKMLYDNALLVSLIADAYKVTKSTRYEEVIRQSLAFIEREMMSEEGGFYASYDADSEGEEGKFYVWQESEIDGILSPKNASIFKLFYDVSSGGNWEHKNILNRNESDESFAKNNQLSLIELQSILEDSRQKLFEYRTKRVKPALDDKILLSWNALMNTAYTKAYEAIGEEHYLEMAKQNMDFLLSRFKRKDDATYYHTYKEGLGRFPAFIDDYAFLIKALIDLYEVSFDEKYLKEAFSLTSLVRKTFMDQEDCLYYYTSETQKDIAFRKKEFFDNATPSANSTMAGNLLRLGVLYDETAWITDANKMLKLLEPTIRKYPSSLGRWANTLIDWSHSYNEIAVIGEVAHKKASALHAYFIPNRILLASESEDTKLSLLQNRYVQGQTLYYLCRDHACQMPVEETSELLDLLKE